VQVERGKLGSHRFHAHGEDRRAKDRDKDKDKDKDKDEPKPPPRKDDKAPQSDADSSGRRRPHKGRWSDVRKGWS
jgi:hypothetical protein